MSKKYRIGFLPTTISAWMMVATLLSATGVQAQTTLATNAKEAALQAIESNPDVQSRFHAFKASAHDVTIARAGWRPSVDVTASAGKANRDYDGRASYDTSRAEISLSQMLFNGFRTTGEIEHFSSARQVRYYELLNQIETTTLDALASYEDVVRTRELVTLAKENYAKHREVLAQIEDRVSSGVGRRVDLEQVGGRLALAESNLLTEASNLHDATARYLRVVGTLPASDIQPTEFAADKLLPADVTDALRLAYQGNAGFHAAIKNIAAAQATVKVERAGYLPKAELRARQNVTRNNSGFDDRVDRSRYGDEGIVELAISYNLYNGGANRAAVRRSLEEVNQAKDLRDQVCVDLRQTTQVAYNDSQRIREQQISLAQHRLSSDKVRHAYSEQFNIGQRTLLDLLDAENEFFQASRAAINASSDLTIANARTLAAMGKLLPALSIVRDGLNLLDNVDIAQLQVDAATACPAEAPTALRRDDLVSVVIPVSGDALFAVNSSELNSTASASLNQLLAQIQDTANVVEIRIAGHTDSSGSDQINLPLSKARAQRVRDYLVLNGLELSNIVAEGFGSSRPVADNNTESGRAANRRVDVTITRQR